MAIHRRTFSLAFKQGFLHAVATKQAKASDLIAKYDLARSTYDRWLKQQKEGTLTGDDSGNASFKRFGDEIEDAQEVEPINAVVLRNGAAMESVLRDELTRLRMDNETLRRERDLFRTAWLEMRS